MPFKTLAEVGRAGRKLKRPEDLPMSEIVFNLLKTRQSIRKYRNKEVPLSYIEKLLLAASLAPSAGNQQPWEFVVVRDPATKKHLAETTYDSEWMANAPLIVVACINMRVASAIYGERGEKLYGIQDVAAACENMLIMAHSLGLGSCWVGGFAEPRAAIAIHSPDYVRPAAILTFGFPDEHPDVIGRHPLSEFVHEEQFGETEREKKSQLH